MDEVPPKWSIEAICDGELTLIAGIIAVTDPLGTVTLNGESALASIVPTAFATTGSLALFVGKPQDGNAVDIVVDDANGTSRGHVEVGC